MATQSFEQLIAGANKIKTNELPESNTASLVGEQLIQMVNKQSEEYEARIKGTTEYNVSVQHPTGGIGGSNKYTLETAIQKIPAELRTVGIKCSFLTDKDENNQPTKTHIVTYVFTGGTFVNLGSWVLSGNETSSSTEFNVSEKFPTGGANGTNKYTLETAIAKIPASHKKLGVKILFFSEDGWQYYLFAADNLVYWTYYNQWINLLDNALLKLDWLGDAVKTRNQVFKSQRKKGMLVTYKDPEVKFDSGWVVERYINDTIFYDANFGNKIYWHRYDQSEQLEIIKKELESTQEELFNVQHKSSIVPICTYKGVNGVFDKYTMKVDFDQSKSVDGVLKIEINLLGSLADKIEMIRQTGGEPRFEIYYDIDNISSYDAVYYFKDTGNRTLEGGGLQRKQFGKYLCSSYILPENTTFISISFSLKAKGITTESSYLQILVARCFFENTIFNDFFQTASIDKNLCMPVLFDISKTDIGNNFSIINDETVSVSLPKKYSLERYGLRIPVRSVVTPLNLIGTSWLIVEYEGDNIFDYADEIAFSHGTSAVILALNKIDSINYFAGRCIAYRIESVLKNSITNKYHSPYKYDSPYLVLGCVTPKTMEKNIISKLRIRIFNASYDANLNRQLQELRTRIDDLQHIIGRYTTNYTKPYAGIVSISQNVNLINNGCLIADGTSEKDEYIEYRFDIQRVRFHGCTKPVFRVSFMTDKKTEDDIKIKGEIFTKLGSKVQDVTVDMAEIYNGIIRVEFDIYQTLSWIDELILRITFISEKSKGVSFNLYDCSVYNLSAEDTIANRLNKLQYDVNPLVVQSNNGTKFKISVSDEGILGVQKALPSKMLILSHSWGHISPINGWYGDWGMAASAEHLDMVHQIATLGKAINPEFTTVLKSFGTFAVHAENESSWSQWDFSDLDFDCVFICSFVAGAKNWSTFDSQLYKCIKNYVCKGKTDVKVYITPEGTGGSSGPGHDACVRAANLFGTQPIDGEECLKATGTGAPWLMPPKPDGSYPIKVDSIPPGANPADYIDGGGVGHPGNYGFYVLSKNLVNQMHIDYNVPNSNPDVLSFEDYKKQPDIIKYIDPDFH